MVVKSVVPMVAWRVEKLVVPWVDVMVVKLAFEKVVR